MDSCYHVTRHVRSLHQTMPELNVSCRTIATIYDLQLTICSLENVESFDDLTLGPVQEIPLVKRFFNLPAGQAEVLQVTQSVPIFLLAICCQICCDQTAIVQTSVCRFQKTPLTFFGNINPYGTL